MTETMSPALVVEVRALCRRPLVEQNEYAERLKWEREQEERATFAMPPEPERTPGADWPSTLA